MSAQFGFLNTLRRERRLVVVYLLSGTRLQGRIASFDQRGLLLETKTGMVLCSQDQISTVGLDLPRASVRPRAVTPGRQPLPAREAHHSEPRAGKRAPEPALEPQVSTSSENPGLAPMESREARVPVVTQKPKRKIVLPEMQTGTGR